MGNNDPNFNQVQNLDGFIKVVRSLLFKIILCQTPYYMSILYKYISCTNIYNKQYIIVDLFRTYFIFVPTGLLFFVPFLSLSCRYLNLIKNREKCFNYLIVIKQLLINKQNLHQRRLVLSFAYAQFYFKNILEATLFLFLVFPLLYFRIHVCL